MSDCYRENTEHNLLPKKYNFSFVTKVKDCEDKKQEHLQFPMHRAGQVFNSQPLRQGVN